MMRAVPRSRKGFTLIELMIVLIIFGILGGLVMFNLPQLFARTRLLASANNVASVFQRARLEAIRRNEPATVGIVDGVLVATIGELTFTSRLQSGVRFAAPSGKQVVDGFGTSDVASYRVDGTVLESGAVRLAGDRGYFMEVRVDPPATARTEIRKWDPLDEKFEAQGEGGESWEW